MSPSPVAPDVTLQLNLCAGDLAYGDQVVSALVATHRPDVREVVIVADACRPQSTPYLHAPSRFPAAEFSARVKRLREWCAQLQAAGRCDRVVWLEPAPAQWRALNEKYAGIATPRSHDHLGHAFSAYFLGWDCARTRYVAHFDADILLWQQPGFSWLRAAVAALEADESFVAASPRIAPPLDDGAMVRVGVPDSGWSTTWPLAPVNAGWRSPWFSTRCHVMDRTRLARVLPLRGHRPQQRDAAVNTLLMPFCRWLPSGVARRIPPFPLPPEVMLHEHAQIHDFGCLYLGDPRAWFIHPDTKSDQFLRLLPQLLASAVARGAAPAAQRGLSGVQFAAWETFAAAL